MPRKFKHWAHLNNKGKNTWGDIFPKGTIPVVSMIHRTGPLGEKDNIENYFMVQWDEFSDEQQKETISIVCEKLGCTPKEFLKQVAEFGLPLRKSLTCGSGTNHPGFFF